MIDLTPVTRYQDRYVRLNYTNMRTGRGPVGRRIDPSNGHLPEEATTRWMELRNVELEELYVVPVAEGNSELPQVGERFARVLITWDANGIVEAQLFRSWRENDVNSDNYDEDWLWVYLDLQQFRR